MAQWVNHLRNNVFVNPLPLPLLCEISGALHLRYSPVTTSQTHALPRISTRGYTQKAAVCHA